jgi:hypothetical protein
MMARTVADRFRRNPCGADVKRIYGIVGDSLNGLTDSFCRHGKIEWIHVRMRSSAGWCFLFRRASRLRWQRLYSLHSEDRRGAGRGGDPVDQADSCQ